MEKSLYQIVKGCQENDERCFEIMYGKFLPLLKKYSNRFYDRDDAFDVLLYSFTVCLYQMPVNNERFRQEGRIISYISTTLKNSYFALCKEESKRINTICEYEELKERYAADEVGIDDEILFFH